MDPGVQTSGRLTGVWAQLKDAVTTYRLLFDESGLPGLRFVLGFRHPLRRLAWLAVYAVLFVLTMRDTHKLLTEYYAYDDRVNQEILEMRTFALSNRLKQWISEEQRRNLSRAEKLGHQLEDMIQVCRVHEGDCLSTKILEIRMVPRYGNCYCLGCNSSRFSWQAMQMSDPENGKYQFTSITQSLRMSLNMEPEEFLPLTVDAGFYIMVHQAGAQEEVFDNAVYAPPGATTYIGVSKACDEYCYQVHIFEKCGCRSFNHIRVFAPQLMESPGLCGHPARGLRKIRRSENRPENNHVQMSDGLIHVRVVVFMRSTKVLYKSKEPKLSLSNLFRNIGGLMGVYLGYSSLQIFHVLDVLVDGAYSSLSGVWSRYTRNRQRKRAQAPLRRRDYPLPEEVRYPVTTQPTMIYAL
ncbi:hypothetical protein MTO96_002028 [Rhipicephalus appendiculatus]